VRALVDVRLEQMLENPNQQPVSAYDERADQWTTVYGDGLGLNVYAVVREPGQPAARKRSDMAHPGVVTMGLSLHPPGTRYAKMVRGLGKRTSSIEISSFSL
jgi:hypothetical protein